MDNPERKPILFLSMDIRRVLYRGEAVEATLLRRSKLFTIEPTETENQLARARIGIQAKGWEKRGGTPEFVLMADKWHEAVGLPLMMKWPAGKILITDEELAALNLPIAGFVQRGGTKYFVAEQFVEPEPREVQGRMVWVKHIVRKGREETKLTPAGTPT